jgi:hypothetical protein
MVNSRAFSTPISNAFRARTPPEKPGEEFAIAALPRPPVRVSGPDPGVAINACRR